MCMTHIIIILLTLHLRCYKLRSLRPFTFSFLSCVSVQPDMTEPHENSFSIQRHVWLIARNCSFGSLGIIYRIDAQFNSLDYNWKPYRHIEIHIKMPTIYWKEFGIWKICATRSTRMTIDSFFVFFFHWNNCRYKDLSVCTSWYCERQRGCGSLYATGMCRSEGIEISTPNLTATCCSFES